MTKTVNGLFIEDLEKRQAPATFPPVLLPPQASEHANPNAPFSDPVYTTMALGEEDGGGKITGIYFDETGFRQVQNPIDGDPTLARGCIGITALNRYGTGPDFDALATETIRVKLGRIEFKT